MQMEKKYIDTVSKEHIKSLGQFFTNYDIASFMCQWLSPTKSLLDPAVGNSIFFRKIKEFNPFCECTGYEIDTNILEYFGNPSKGTIYNDDYLLNGWNERYDAIVCNPPYNRFQQINNRDNIIKSIYDHTGLKCSGYTNLYVLFLIKSIFQLSDIGRLAYIIPSEFLNSKYGKVVKDLMVRDRLLRAIINFENNNDLFHNATTTCCIILIDKEPKKYVEFYCLSSIDELKNLCIGDDLSSSYNVTYEHLTVTEKWRKFLYMENSTHYHNLTDVSKFCYATRGIATGANDYFCFTNSKLKENNIPLSATSKCICHSSDIRSLFFTDIEFNKLADSNKQVYILDVSEKTNDLVDYLEKGIANGIDKKYLPSCRTPWFSMEKKKPAPIWVSTACRKSIKFIRNLTDTKTLTTFHSVFVNAKYISDTNLLFCYFITPIAQEILRENRKELGNGLDKFQPNDINNAQMLDISVISENDKYRIMDIYSMLINNLSEAYINELNSIFLRYL